MTLDEIKAELQAIKEELAKLEALVGGTAVIDPPPPAAIEPPDLVVEGPNEWGAVKLSGVESVKEDTWVLWAPTITSKKYTLNEQQLACITLNCGYDIDSDSFVPAAFYFVGAQGYGPEAEKISGMTHESVFKKQYDLPFLKKKWTLDMEKRFPNTIAVRTKNVKEIMKGLNQIAGNE